MQPSRNTIQKKLVYEALLHLDNHPTAEEIFAEIGNTHTQVSRGTVYRNLGVLSEDGEITDAKVPAADRYDSRLDRHYHLFCTGCGRVFDAPVPYQMQFDAQVAQQTGFKVNRHRVVFEGLCPVCSGGEQDG